MATLLGRTVQHVDLLITNAGQLLTLQGAASARAGEEMNDLGLIDDGAVAVMDGAIVSVGPGAELQKQFSAEQVIDAEGRLVMPGCGILDTLGGFIGYTNGELFHRKLQRLDV